MLEVAHHSSTGTISFSRLGLANCLLVSRVGPFPSQTPNEFGA